MKPESTYGSGIDGDQDGIWTCCSRYGRRRRCKSVCRNTSIGLESVEGTDGDFALVLLEEKDTLLQVNLANPSQSVEVDLPAPPISITTQPSMDEQEKVSFPTM